MDFLRLGMQMSNQRHIHHAIGQNRKEREAKAEQTMDEVDMRIMRELTTDSRRSFREIARNIGVSPATVLSRTRRLEGMGVIRHYTAVFDHEKLGYDISVLIEITGSRGKLVEVEERISHFQNVCGVYDVTGETDAIIVAKFRNRRELNSFVKSLLAMDYVERTNTRVVLNIVKEDFRLI